jgi:hypothetical protein
MDEACPDGAKSKPHATQWLPLAGRPQLGMLARPDVGLRIPKANGAFPMRPNP